MKQFVCNFKEIKTANLQPFLYFLISFLGLCCTTKAQQEITNQENKSLEVVSVQFEKWTNNEANFFDILADEVIWTVSGNSPVSGIYTSKKVFLEQAVEPILEKLKTPLKPKLTSLTTDDNFVWLHFTATAESINNRIYENDYIWKMQLKNDKIISCIAFLDTYALTELMNNKETTMHKTIEETKEYIGMWVTADENIRHEYYPIADTTKQEEIAKVLTKESTS